MAKTQFKPLNSVITSPTPLALTMRRLACPVNPKVMAFHFNLVPALLTTYHYF